MYAGLAIFVIAPLLLASRAQDLSAIQDLARHLGGRHGDDGLTWTQGGRQLELTRSERWDRTHHVVSVPLDTPLPRFWLARAGSALDTSWAWLPGSDRGLLLGGTPRARERVLGAGLVLDALRALMKDPQARSVELRGGRLSVLREGPFPWHELAREVGSKLNELATELAGGETPATPGEPATTGHGPATGAPRVVVRRPGLRCPYCHDGLDPRAARACPACATPHHEPCLDEAGGCTVLACRARPRGLRARLRG